MKMPTDGGPAGSRTDFSRVAPSCKDAQAMRTVSLINQKGGCGKTTSSINLAACLAHLNQRTLLVDMDPQGHCAVGLAVPDAQIERSIYDVLRITGSGGGGTANLKDITWQIAQNFDLAP